MTKSGVLVIFKLFGNNLIIFCAVVDKNDLIVLLERKND
jgi:hypothetical protein